MREKSEICGAPESATIRKAGAARELRRVALLCPDQVAVELVKAVREEHRQATEPDRALVRDVKDRGGVCPLPGLTLEEWRDRVPRALRGKRGHCAPADELAQEFFDRGTIAEPTTDAVLDHLTTVHARARSDPPIPEERELRKEALRIVRQRVGRAVRELVRTAQRDAKESCLSPRDTK